MHANTRSIAVLFAASLALACGSATGPGGGASDSGGDPDVDAGPGCSTDARCASGLCLDTGDCANCTLDFECGEGRSCAGGACAPTCSASCSAGFTCCEGRCVDTTLSYVDCGACGVLCGPAQVCERGQCAALDLGSFCASQQITLVRDGLEGDDTIINSLEPELQALCGGSVRVVGPTDAGFFDANGAPLGADGLLVAVGGPFAQPVVSHLEWIGATPVHFSGDDLAAAFVNTDSAALVQTLRTDLTDGHDYFLLEMVREPVNGAEASVVYGFGVPGTRAGAWYLANQVLPSAASVTDRWRVVEWTDRDGDALPGAADSFTVKGSGP